MRENWCGKEVGIIAGGTLMIGIGHDNSDNRRGSGEIAQVHFSQWNWIDNPDTGRGSEGTGTEVTFYRGIVVLPDPDPWGKRMKFSVDHLGRVPGKKGLIKAWHYRCSTRYRNYKQ